MGNRATPPRSFNTIRQTQYKKRAQRTMRSRILLLAICAVLILIFLAVSVLLVCSLVDMIGSNAANGPDSSYNDSDTPQQAIKYQPATKMKKDIHSGTLILINKIDNHEYLFPSDAERNLVIISDEREKVNGSTNLYEISDYRSAKLQKETVTALNAMMRAYYELSNDNTVTIGSAYRDYQMQASLSNPGFSDHHSGYCFSLKNMSLEAAEWIYSNCHKYGFIQRYPDNKVGETGISGYDECFRYVGVAHATYMFENDLCLEEYVEMLQNRHSKNSQEHLRIQGADGNLYDVYYTPASDKEVTVLNVPENYSYTISGDNTDDKTGAGDALGGFIITVNLSDPIQE